MPRSQENRDLKAPLRSKLKYPELEVVWWLLGIQPLDVTGIDAHRIDRRLAVVKPECHMIADRGLCGGPDGSLLVLSSVYTLFIIGGFLYVAELHVMLLIHIHILHR